MPSVYAEAYIEIQFRAHEAMSFVHVIRGCPPLAPLRHADGLRKCLLIVVERKSSADSQNVALDPLRTHMLSSAWRLHG